MELHDFHPRTILEQLNNSLLASARHLLLLASKNGESCKVLLSGLSRFKNERKTEWQEHHADLAKKAAKRLPIRKTPMLWTEARIGAFLCSCVRWCWDDDQDELAALTPQSRQVMTFATERWLLTAITAITAIYKFTIAKVYCMPWAKSRCKSPCVMPAVQGRNAVPRHNGMCLGLGGIISATIKEMVS